MYYSPFLNAGTTFACFQSVGISPDFSDYEKMDVKIGATCSFNSFNTLPCILSGPHALCGFILLKSYTQADDMFICGILVWGLWPLSKLQLFPFKLNSIVLKM